MATFVNTTCDISQIDSGVKNKFKWDWLTERDCHGDFQKALHLYSRGLGGREGPLMAEIYIFCFPIFSPNMSGISEVSLGYDGSLVFV